MQIHYNRIIEGPNFVKAQTNHNLFSKSSFYNIASRHVGVICLLRLCLKQLLFFVRKLLRFKKINLFEKEYTHIGGLDSSKLLVKMVIVLEF